MNPLQEGSHPLPDGRVLRWAQWGAPAGRPVLFHHGTPASRLQRFDDHALVHEGILLTTVDRPGVGGSSPQPGRRVIDWPEDAARLLDALHLEQVVTVGHSMGGSYALACAVRMPERIERVGLWASIGPWNESDFRDIVPDYVRPLREAYERDAEEAVEEFRRSIRRLCEATLQRPDETVDRFASVAVSEADQRLLKRDEAQRAGVRENMIEHFAQGIEGLLEERMAGHIHAWGFRLSDVAAPVHVFQGREDSLSPPAVGHALAERLPRATLHELEGLGHFVPADRQAAILRTLCSDTAPESSDASSSHRA